MKVFVPGKLVVTGAYAVLHGAPAVVVAVSRGLTATPVHFDVSPCADQLAPRDGDSANIDAGPMFIDNKKLGLGVSAARLVASPALRAALKGHDLSDAKTRARVFEDARTQHALRDKGGSGVDVAAVVYGGALVYSLRDGVPAMRPVSLPSGVTISAFFSGESALTPELRAAVDALRTKDEIAFKRALAPVALAAEASVRAIDAGDARAFIDACDQTGTALAALGDAAGASIVPPAFRELATLAAEEGAAFLPSGAGGGDSGIYVGRAPSSHFLERIAALHFVPLDVRIDARGVRLV